MMAGPPFSRAQAEVDAAHPFADADGIAQSVVALAVKVVSKRWERVLHRHRKAQLLYVVRGVLRFQMEGGLWIIPPRCAVWIPGGIPHAAEGAQGTECYGLYIEPEGAPDLPRRCCTLAVTSLLRELIIRMAEGPRVDEDPRVLGRLMATLLDELNAAPVEHLNLPLPAELRLRSLVDLLLADPAGRAGAAAYAARVGMSVRNMTRLFSQQLGMSRVTWRHRLHVVLALQRLAAGDRVQAIALDLGYDNASSFITMFRKAVGQTPARYVSDRMAGPVPAPSRHVRAPALLSDSF